MSETRFSVPVAAGALAGAGAWIVGLLVSAVVTLSAVREDLRVIVIEEVTGSRIDWQAVGWLFYNAHNVDTEVPRISLLSSGYQNFLTGGEETLWYLFLLPPVALVAAGALVAVRARHESRSPADTALAGATVAVGYAPLCILGIVLFAVDVGSATIRPDPLMAVLLAGVAYPLVFGGLGGLAVGALSSR
ncbi:hypothetical protein [Natronobiforma cellulositropha]|uniref:hypothetical protein n=1 Tax=Natronobiforma cellulositropha TaxID=1679076 RepID=UPI0021D5705C|nr:hypothetical protein [Natronobiforma cellulositropha]